MRSDDPHVKVEAIAFDLLTALLDSWTLWNRAAGNDVDGRRWRNEYLRMTYAAGDYRAYDSLVRESAAVAGVRSDAADHLFEGWGTMEPWPEVPDVLASLGLSYRIAVVTNCSSVLAERAVHCLGVTPHVIVAAERAGAYKPDPRPYRLALSELRAPAERVLFVAGSPFDIPGAGGVGMPVAWHNRLRLARPAGVAAPRYELATLDALQRLVRDPAT